MLLAELDAARDRDQADTETPPEWLRTHLA
jgi:hypothetical protein